MLIDLGGCGLRMWMFWYWVDKLMWVWALVNEHLGYCSCSYGYLIIIVVLKQMWEFKVVMNYQDL